MAETGIGNALGLICDIPHDYLADIAVENLAAGTGISVSGIVYGSRLAIDCSQIEIENLFARRITVNGAVHPCRGNVNRHMFIHTANRL